MNAIEKLRAIVDTIKNLRVVMPDVANRGIPSGRFALTAAAFCELLQEIDRMRSESAGVREACARICDERAVMFSSDHFLIRTEEATNCAAAIRAGGKP